MWNELVIPPLLKAFIEKEFQSMLKTQRELEEQRKTIRPKLKKKEQREFKRAKRANEKLTQAEKWLAEAKRLEDLRQTLDAAIAAEAYAKTYKLGLAAENYATEVRLSVARKIGELEIPGGKLPTLKGKDKPYLNIFIYKCDHLIRKENQEILKLQKRHRKDIHQWVSDFLSKRKFKKDKGKPYTSNDIKRIINDQFENSFKETRFSLERFRSFVDFEFESFCNPALIPSATSPYSGSFTSWEL